MEGIFVVQDLLPARPLLAALLPLDGSAAGPLEALRVEALSWCLEVLPAFASTLRHLMLPKLPGSTALDLPGIVVQLTALEVRSTVGQEI